MKKYLPHIFFSLFFLLFALKGVGVLDPDLGWHLKMGELILRSGIPKTDPFSYTMPSYPFVDHEWLTNIVLFFIYSRGGLVTLALLFALLSAATMALVLWRRSGWWDMLYAAVLFCILFPFAGVRPQVISWLFTVIFLMILCAPPRRQWVLVPLMALWTNLHGGFFVGVGMVGVAALVAAINKKHAGRATALAILVLLATLINPYRERIWWEVFMQLTDSSLRFFISEWMPAIFFLNFTYWLYAVFAAVVVARYRKRVPLFQRMVFWLSFLAGLSSMRNIPLWLFVSVYPVTAGLTAFLAEARQTGERRGRLRFVLVRLNMVLIIVVLLQLSVLFFGSRDEIRYPQKAVAYIQNKKLSGNILAIYGWGGYLIWELPGHKVFIDGRMPSWRRDRAPDGESSNARRDYNRFFESAVQMETVGKKYRVAYVLTRSIPKQTAFEKWITRIFSLKPAKPTPVNTLPIIYDDGEATIRAFR